ncbi:MAG: phosphate acyltransferase PlsX [Deltaproteobacteria bacterium]|nr:phosphate acyltransferase PlsX [Deltaproteobacteria bacterium]
MSVSLPIAVDAMGGDFAPEPEVFGAIEAVDAGIGPVVLFGAEARVESVLGARGISRSAPGLEVVNADSVVTMDDHPAEVLRNKRDSSLALAFDSARAGRSGGVVSAGNSGAMMAFAVRTLGRLPGVDRPAIACPYPTKKGVAVLCDAGANTECRPLQLAQFGVMGAAYARLILGAKRPRVAVLSNGSEGVKGTALTREASEMLQGARTDAFDFAGYVEGRDVVEGEIDVVVTDGFTGNVTLKVIEGVGMAVTEILKGEVKKRTFAKAGALLMKPALLSMKARFDYAQYGGAPLVGVDGVAIVCHGGSPARAIRNAIRVARGFVNQKVGDEIVRVLRETGLGR